MDFLIRQAWDGDRTVISIDGRLDEKGLAELGRVCREAKDPITLDLSELRSADDSAIDAIRALADQGLQLNGLSPFMRLRLSGGASK